jgi:hypothetical protein
MIFRKLISKKNEVKESAGSKVSIGIKRLQRRVYVASNAI